MSEKERRSRPSSRRNLPKRRKVKLAVSIGDPSGIGPEIVSAIARSRRLRREAELVLVGDPGLFKRWGAPSGAVIEPIALSETIRPGKISAASGRHSFEAFARAVDLARRGDVDGVVTAPVSKEAWRQAKVGVLDHTQYLRRFGGDRGVAMALLSGRLLTVLVTGHHSLREVCGKISSKNLDRVFELSAREFAKVLDRKPRMALCALNPHAGERGMLGREEIRLLEPAVKRWKGRLASTALLPADDAWKKMAQGSMDAVISLYHDQAMIPLKTAEPERIVNWTLGLPFVRTSPGHGTAEDIAGKGIADARPILEAALWAARRARR